MDGATGRGGECHATSCVRIWDSVREPWRLYQRRIDLIAYLLSKYVSFRRRMDSLLWLTQVASAGSGSRIGRYVVINGASGLRLGTDVAIGDFVHIWAGGGVSIGDDCLIAAHTVISSQSHRVDALALGAKYRSTNISSPVVIGRNVWIASNVVIGPGVSVGDDSIIGAGSVVLTDIPARSLAVGAPARVVRMLN